MKSWAWMLLIGFAEKYAIGEYAKTKGFKSVVIISMGWYMENHIIEENADLMGGFPFHPDAEGYLTLQMPGWGGDGNVPWIAVDEDYGDIAHGVLLDPEAYNGRQARGPGRRICQWLVAPLHVLTGIFILTLGSDGQKGAVRRRGRLEEV